MVPSFYEFVEQLLTELELSFDETSLDCPMDDLVGVDSFSLLEAVCLTEELFGLVLWNDAEHDPRSMSLRDYYAYAVTHAVGMTIDMTMDS